MENTHERKSENTVAFKLRVTSEEMLVSGTRPTLNTTNSLSLGPETFTNCCLRVCVLMTVSLNLIHYGKMQ